MKYRCDSVESRRDGSGEIAWDIWAIDNKGVIIPGRHCTVLTPAADTQLALDSGPASLKQLLVDFAPKGWDDVALDERVTANASSEVIVASIDTFVAGIGGYPVEFSLGDGVVETAAAPPAQPLPVIAERVEVVIPEDDTIVSLNVPEPEAELGVVEKVVAAVKGVFRG